MPTATVDPREVQALLAHRYPFLLVDVIHVLEPGRRVVGIKQVTTGEWATGGTAIAQPPFGRAGWSGGLAMPGVLVVEALAQTSAAILLDLLERSAGAVGYFAAIERVRLRDPAVPGDTMRLEVELRSFRRGIAKLRGLATVDGRRIASADFTTVIRPGAKQ